MFSLTLGIRSFVYVLFVMAIVPTTLAAAQAARCKVGEDWWGFCWMDFAGVFALPIAVALVAPWIANRWQNKQRDSQTKTQLVADISDLVMTTIMTVILFKDGHLTKGNSSSPEDELRRVYKEWTVRTCVIGSKLHAYFPDKKKGNYQLHIQWDNFSKRVKKYYEDVTAQGSQLSAGQIDAEKEDLFERKARIIDETLASKITGFRRANSFFPWRKV